MTSISHSIQSMQPLFRRIPKITDLKLHDTKNTIAVCRVCRGTRLVAIESSVLHTYRFEKCLLCKGTGTMSTREASYDKR